MKMKPKRYESENQRYFLFFFGYVQLSCWPKRFNAVINKG